MEQLDTVPLRKTITPILKASRNQFTIRLLGFVNNLFLMLVLIRERGDALMSPQQQYMKSNCLVEPDILRGAATV